MTLDTNANAGQQSVITTVEENTRRRLQMTMKRRRRRRDDNVDDKCYSSTSSFSSTSGLRSSYYLFQRNNHSIILRVSIISLLLCSLNPRLLICSAAAVKIPTRRLNRDDHYQHHKEHRRQQQLRQQGFEMNYENPTLHWMMKLPNDEQLHQGNVITQSPFDSSQIYVTTNTGKLLVVSIVDGSIVKEIQPSPKVYTQDWGTETWTISCNSGISFSDNGRRRQQQNQRRSNDVDGDQDAGDENEFLIYSIQDIPPKDSSYGPKTRVVAVSIPDHHILWTSSGLPGITNNNNNHNVNINNNEVGSDHQNSNQSGGGRPLIYFNKGDHKNYVLLTHNSRFTNDIDDSITIAGHVTLLDAEDNGKIVWTDSEWNSGTIPKGYSPPGIGYKDTTTSSTSNPDDGPDENDIVIWSNNDITDNGNGEGGSRSSLHGFTFKFQLPIDFTATQLQIDELKTKPLKVVRWNSIVSPVFNHGATHMFIGVGNSEVRGWVGNGRSKPFDEAATWTATTTDDDGLFAPIPVTPTLSKDETRLFVPSAQKDLMCIDTQTGTVNWSVQGTSTFLAQSKVSPDDQSVYAIQSVDGRIVSYNQLSGDLNWLASCDQFEEDCANSVRADFEITSTGQYLIYGDVVGRIIALKLGELLDKTSSNDGATNDGHYDDNNNLDPQGHRPWQKEETAQNTNVDEEKSSAFVISLLLIIFAIVVVALALAYMLVTKRLKTRPHPMQEPYIMDDDDTMPDTNDDYSMPLDPDTAPDKYEDSMISRHKLPTKSLISASMETRSLDSMSVAPADRISSLLGTSNKVAPILEDFSYGAAILV